MGYNRPTGKDIGFLRGVTGDPERVLIGSEINEDYFHDELGGVFSEPDVVVKAMSADEVIEVMRYANSNRIPVTPRGSGTGLVGSSVAVEHGILLDLSSMNRILELDKENMTVSVEPGVLLMDLAAYAEGNGLFYPPDPGEKTATIGGNISTNAGGMRAVKYGVTRDYIKGLDVVLADGELLNLGGKIVKNSSGYDLMSLIIGSEGTLGVVTKAVLKLLPLPERVVSMLVPFPTLEAAIRTVPLIVGSGAAPAAVEFMERGVITDSESYLGRKFPDNSAEAYLLLRFDGMLPEEISRRFDAAAEICLENGALDVLISDTEDREDSIWKARGAFLEAIKSGTPAIDEADIVVPRSHVADMMLYAHSLQDEIGLRIQGFGHAGDGNVHIYLLRDDLSEEEWQVRLKAGMEKLYAKGYALEGRASGEHGIGWAKREYLKQHSSPREIELMRALKRAFDPNLILNPGKVCW